ncbi:hypothetical protein XENTR_v10002629 [Xenopus tropicalis]|nr:hypothetical protein XENTR_v10002629 [Xenopus tropicalis]
MGPLFLLLIVADQQHDTTSPNAKESTMCKERSAAALTYTDYSSNNKRTHRLAQAWARYG